MRARNLTGNRIGAGSAAAARCTADYSKVATTRKDVNDSDDTNEVRDMGGNAEFPHGY